MFYVTKRRAFNSQNFVIGEINKILEKLKTSTQPNNEHALCQEQIKYLREENISKNLIIKRLSQNQNTFNGSLPQQLKSYEPYYDSNVSFIDPKNKKKKDTPHNFFITKSFFKFGF